MEAPLLARRRRRKGMKSPEEPKAEGPVACGGRGGYAPRLHPGKAIDGQLFGFGAASGRRNAGGGARRARARAGVSGRAGREQRPRRARI
ncbi:protein of unknown function [uncultured Sphingopyxis sp.]|uniref:Uncharacterized protein n=1 Tax=uncultured Sphingopyxis sp. TaxID=310581 RepID=A0A1Y5PYT8_9SPHN|nr:protein of unknown function [uncultured Sphingopyxis sp.]